MKHLLLFLMLYSTFGYASEINGIVFLDNTTDHGGVVIKFNPVSPSAVYVEGISNSNGEYNVTVVNGVYNISYEKTSYQIYTIADQLIYSDVTLNTVTLNSASAIIVSGNVSGNWSNNNTYIVNGDIFIPQNQTLIIEPGTEIRFNGYFSLIVNGTLKAIGTENNRITFTSNNTNPGHNDWNQIRFTYLSASSEINHCIIEYGHLPDFDATGLIEIAGGVTILNSIIRHSQGTGIKVAGGYAGNVLINNCDIYECEYGISSSGVGQLDISYNRIFDHSLIGIYEGTSSNSHVVISHNIVYNCPYSGIITHNDITISRNILFNNAIGNSYGAAIFVGGGTPMISNNTMFSNQNGVGIYDSNFFLPHPIINSNIIINSNGYGIFSQGEPQPALVAYNLFDNNTNGVGNNLPVGVGSVITTNSNGTGSDAYYNIFSSAQLISTNISDPDFCELNSNSDAVNAGDPNI